MVFEHEGIAVNAAKRFFGRCKSEQDYEDLLQITRMIIIDLQKSYDPDKAAFTTYCHHYLYRRLLNYFQTASIRDYLDLETVELDDPCVYLGHDQIQEKRVLLKQLLAHCNKYDKRRQKVLSMHLLGYQNKDIAKKYKVSAERVRQLLNEMKRDRSFGTKRL